MIFKGKNLENVDGVKGNFIEGVEIKRLRKIPDERGTIYHMLTKDDEIFEDFGEIYFSNIYPQVVKAWHWHKYMVLNYSVVYGMIKMVLYDDRKNSPTFGNLMEIFLGEENHILVKVPKQIWNGFKGIGLTKAIVANCSTISHDPDEIFRKKFNTEDIPYDWELKNE
jgi:dTDP-4-dehydrorhamnose 3,5-epimerase